MKLVIAGSRDLKDYEIARSCILSGLAAKRIETTVTQIVSGKCPSGADFFGEEFAKEIGVPVIGFNAGWEEFGKAAGPIRNEEMAIYADVVFVLINNNSKGSLNMIKNAMKHKKPLMVFKFIDQKLVAVHNIGD